jgi:S-adenosylmethionine/arginine decarboxylase-like enzyme
MLLLMESHLTVHTFPEHGTLCLNLFCCRRRPAGDFAAWLDEFHPQDVTIRLIERRVSESEPRPSENNRSLTVAAPTRTAATPSEQLETTR